MIAIGADEAITYGDLIVVLAVAVIVLLLVYLLRRL